MTNIKNFIRITFTVYLLTFFAGCSMLQIDTEYKPISRNDWRFDQTPKYPLPPKMPYPPDDPYFFYQCDDIKILVSDAYSNESPSFYFGPPLIPIFSMPSLISFVLGPKFKPDNRLFLLIKVKTESSSNKTVNRERVSLYLPYTESQLFPERYSYKYNVMPETVTSLFPYSRYYFEQLEETQDYTPPPGTPDIHIYEHTYEFLYDDYLYIDTIRLDFSNLIDNCNIPSVFLEKDSEFDYTPVFIPSLDL